MKKILLCAVLAFAVRASGQTTYTDHPNGDSSLIPTVQSELPNTVLGVVIESWRYDPADKIVILHLVNNSGKDVTAFNISIAEKYADGSTNYLDGTPSDIHDHQMVQDMLLTMINIHTGLVRHGGGIVVAGAGLSKEQAMQEAARQAAVPQGNGTFAAGTSRDFVDHVSKDVSDIQALVDVVIYADATVQVQDNDRAFRQLAAQRKGQLLAMERVTEVVKGVLADPMVMSPYDAAMQQLRPLVDAAETAKHGPPEDTESNAAMYLQMDVRGLQMIPRSAIWTRMNMTEREWLTQYVERQEKRIELMKPHCELVIAK